MLTTFREKDSENQRQYSVQIQGPEKYMLSDQETKVLGRCKYWQL